MTETGAAENRKPPFQFLTRLVPLAVIVVMLMLLLPHLKQRAPVSERFATVEPPLALQTYNTVSDSLNTLLYEGLKHFGRKDYDEAARLLAQAHFFCSVKVKEKKLHSYPRDLRFYLGLAYYYRDQAAAGIPLLEEEEGDAPDKEKYPWYLAHLYLAAGDNVKAEEKLERVITLGGPFAAAAGEKLKILTAADAEE